MNNGVDGGSWGLSLFVLFERSRIPTKERSGSWGLSLFVLFEQKWNHLVTFKSSWGLSLFVLFEQSKDISWFKPVLED